MAHIIMVLGSLVCMAGTVDGMFHSAADCFLKPILFLQRSPTVCVCGAYC